MNPFGIVREGVDLGIFAASFTDLSPSGATLRGRCPHPDHDDETPSFYVYPDRHFHCYGCGWHGDATDFWAGVKGLKPGIGAALDLAQERGIDLPEADPEALKKAEERRELEARYLRQAEEALKALPRHPRAVEWWEGRGFDEKLRERFLLGASDDGTEAIIPFWHHGRVHGLIRRRLDGGPNKYLLPKKEEFPEGYRPLFVPGAARGEVFLVEGYIDALSATALGLRAIAVGGTGISPPQMKELKSLPGPIYIVRDNDEEGEKAARRWLEDLYPKALLCPPIPSISEKEEKN